MPNKNTNDKKIFSYGVREELMSRAASHSRVGIHDRGFLIFGCSYIFKDSKIQ